MLRIVRKIRLIRVVFVGSRFDAEIKRKKIGGNILRDRRNAQALKKADIKCLTLWQCELRKTEKVMKRLLRFLGDLRIAKKIR